MSAGVLGWPHQDMSAVLLALLFLGRWVWLKVVCGGGIFSLAASVLFSWLPPSVG